LRASFAFRLRIIMPRLQAIGHATALAAALQSEAGRCVWLRSTVLCCPLWSRCLLFGAPDPEQEDLALRAVVSGQGVNVFQRGTRLAHQPIEEQASAEPNHEERSKVDGRDRERPKGV